METIKIIEKDIVSVNMDEPVLVDQAPGKPEDFPPYAVTEEAKRWGRYRMPKVYKMPDDTIALTYSMSIDHYCDQGRDSPLFVSGDGGKTWEKRPWPHPGLSGMHPVVSQVFGGEYYTIPSRGGIRLDGYEKSASAELKIGSLPFAAHRMSDYPKEVADWYKDIKAMRWSPAAGWTQENAVWDHEGQYIWSYDDKPQNIPGHWGQSLYFEHPVIRCGDELFIADYWTQYENADGSLPKNWGSYLMVSGDNARSWKRRSNITPEYVSAAEPALAQNHAGEFVCAIRSDSASLTGTAPTMYLMHSKDMGYTWDAPKPVLGYGVFPQLLQLENGIMALSYGRAPGTWVSFSPDGGYSWTKPYAILDEAGKASSCGYTSLLALGCDTFLLAYGDIHCKNREGEECKSILVKKITVRPL